MKKCVFIASIVIIVFIFNINIYAEETDINEKQILSLTIDDAIKLAQKNCTELVDIEIKIDETKNSLRKYIKLQEEYDNLLNMSFEELEQAGIYNITENYAEKMLHQYGYYVNQARYTINSLENQKKQLLIKVEIDIKVQYYKIALLEKTLEIYLLDLEKNIYKKNSTKISYENNFATELEMTNEELEALYAQGKYNNSINMLKIEKVTFLQSIGVDSNTDFILKDKELVYTPLDEIVLEDFIVDTIENRPEIVAKKNEIKNIDNYRKIMLSYYGNNSDIGKIEIKRYDNAKIELDNLKNSLSNYIANRYLVLKQSEIALKNNLKQEDILNKENKKINILYDNGQASISEVINSKSKLLSVQIENYKLLTEYIINKYIFENIGTLSYTIK